MVVVIEVGWFGTGLSRQMDLASSCLFFFFFRLSLSLFVSFPCLCLCLGCLFAFWTGWALLRFSASNLGGFGYVMTGVLIAWMDGRSWAACKGIEVFFWVLLLCSIFLRSIVCWLDTEGVDERRGGECIDAWMDGSGTVEEEPEGMEMNGVSSLHVAFVVL
jgi:hypothetical protein